MANGHVEGQVIASLPDQTEQARYCVRLICLVFVEDFGDRTHGPLGRPLDDHPGKNVAVVLAGQRRGDIEVNHAPIPSLRDDARQARTDTAVAIGLRQQDAEFGRYARPGLILQAAGTEDETRLQDADISALARRFMGGDLAYTVEDKNLWVRKRTVADRFMDGRVFLAGDAAHAHPPNGGLGMNTGIQDAFDLGRKLAAVLDGWGGKRLLDSYDYERRPASARAVEVSLKNYPSPIVVPDGTTEPEDDTFGYQPTAFPGARAPQVWLTPDKSILDLFGTGFVLLKFADVPTQRIEEAAASRGVPLQVHHIEHPEAAALYERKLVLVRPDGHVAWRADSQPSAPLELIDTVRGAGPRIAARRDDAGDALPSAKNSYIVAR